MERIRRTRILQGHLEMAPPTGQSSLSGSSSSSLTTNTCSATATAHRQLPRFDVVLMSHFLCDTPGLRDDVYQVFRDNPHLLVPCEEGLTKEQHREIVRQSLAAIIAAGYSPLSLFAKDYKKYFLMAEYLSLVDLSLTVKMGVQYSLWGGSVVNLGTEKHRAKYFDAIDRLALPGSFAMTEVRLLVLYIHC